MLSGHNGNIHKKNPYQVPLVIVACILFFLVGFLVVPSHRQEVDQYGQVTTTSKLAQNVDSSLLNLTQSRHTVYPGPSEMDQLFKQYNLEKYKPPLPAGDKGSDSYTYQPHQIISWYPRIVYYPNFVDKDKADHIIKLAKRRLRPSQVALRKDDKQPLNNGTRTSKGTFMGRDDDPEGVIAWVEDRIAAVTQIHYSQGEHFNILLYEFGKHYSSHLDYFVKDVYKQQDSNRIATMLIYLDAPDEGGETVFLFEGKDGLKRSKDVKDYGQCDMGFKYQPNTGDALLFWSVGMDGTLDQHSIHGGCPVLKGEKWAMTKWIRDNCMQKEYCL